MKKLLLLLVTILLFVNYAMSQDTTAVCGNVANLNVDVTGYSDFTWFAEESDNTVGVFENANSPTTTYTAVSYGNVKFYYDATIGGNIVSDTLYIIFYAVPEPTTTDGIDIVCGHMAELQVNTNPANDGRWIAYNMNYNILPTVVYQDYDDPQSASSNSYPHCYVTVPIPDDVTQVEYIFRWTETVTDSRLTDNCAGEVEKHVVFKKVPVLSVHQCSSTGNSISICDLNTVELCAETAASDGFTDYIWTCNDIEGSFSDPTSNNTTFTPNPDVQITRFLDVDFLFSATYDGCTSTDTMHVRFLQKPSPYAGADAAVCGRNYQLNGELSLQQSDDYTPTCQWEGWWNSYSNVENVTVYSYGIRTYIFREINTAGDDANCYGTDTVIVEFMEAPNVMAGEDFDVCGLDFQLNATSSHVDGDNITGMWTCQSSGTATFEDASNPTTTGHYSQPGYAIFRRIETNHSSIEIENEVTCSSSDDVVVTFYEMPSAVLNMNEDDTIVCGPTFENLRAEEINGRGGFWYDENQSTTFGSANNPESNVTVTTYGRHDFYWIEYDGPDINPRMCLDTTGPWTINFIQQPTAQINGDNVTFYCSYAGQLNASISQTNEGVWTTSEPDLISFDDPSNPNTNIYTTTLNADDNPFYTIYWTVTDAFCPGTDTDSIEVTFTNIQPYAIDTIVDNYIQYGGHTFYATGRYHFEMESEDDDCILAITLNLIVRNDVPDFEAENTNLFPNPAIDVIHIVSPNPIMSIEIFSVEGRCLDIVDINSCDVEYDLSGFLPGTYLVRIYDVNGNIQHKKIVKE